MEKVISFFDFLWGYPLTIFIVLAGLYFGILSRFTQVISIKSVYKNTVGKVKHEKNSLRVILNVLGGTVGSGNIVGVATAIALGGPGALFWMWLTAFFSMATKFVEVTLAVKHQQKGENGNYGGPMYYLSKIKGNFGKIMAFVYSMMLLVYVICDSGFVQINTVSTSLIDTFNISPLIIGIAIILLSFLIIFGGLKRISKVLEKMVPGMCLFYLISALIVIFANVTYIPSSIALIFKYAFRPAPVIGGFAGASIAMAISKGAARGIFANEAGTGTSTTVHATTTNKPVAQGLWGILEVTIVSFIMCTISGLLVLVTSSYVTGLNGAPLILSAFQSFYGQIGKYIFCIVLCSFAYSTYIGFYYEFTTCLKYFFSEKVIQYLRWFYLVPIIFAVFLPIEMIWSFADMSVGFIIIPNIIGLVILSKDFKEAYQQEKKKLNLH